MTKVKISINSETYDISEEQLPLALYVSSEEGLVFGQTAEAHPSAWIELKDEDVFIRAEANDELIQVNGQPLKDGHLLVLGDVIQINGEQLTVTEDDDLLVLSADARRDKLTKPAAFAPLPGKKTRPALRNGLIILFIILSIAMSYVLMAGSIRITVTPSTDVLSLKGFPPAIKLGDNYLALPGQYKVVARHEGYRNLEETITRKWKDADLVYNFTLQKLPGLLNIQSSPINGAQIVLDDQVIGQTPLIAFEVEAGDYELSLSAPRYLVNTQNITVEGMGVKQTLDIALDPDWGRLQVDSDPQQVEVWLNGKMIGQTPLTAEPVGGKYTMELRKEGWKSLFEEVTIEPGKVVELPLFELQKVDGTLVLTSEPTDARVMLNGQFRGNTPITLKVMVEKDHQLSLAKNGYTTVTQSVRVEEDVVRDLNISLDEEYGTVFIMSTPADTELFIDGKLVEGPASRRLRLITTSHQIEIRKKGYQTFKTTVTPNLNLSKKINAQLMSDYQVMRSATQAEIKTAQGQVMRRVFMAKPVQFQMGASRRESGRRSNETQYMVELTRTFDISLKEVTNAEFRAFNAQHNSGDESGFDLNEEDQPVAQVTWDQAARYLNWLSQQDGLPPAYEEKDGEMIPVTPMTTGYRFPTEAEWAFVVRYQGNASSQASPLKYPWGNRKSPSSNNGNYADMSSSTILPSYIQGYNDDFEVASPVGHFQANDIGIYDLGGNVSEWCHDYYDVQVSGSRQVLRNPSGPATGDHHVIRGASWRLGSNTELRLTYRDYSDQSRNDLGFRIARYAQ